MTANVEAAKKKLAEIQNQLKSRMHPDWEEYNAACFPDRFKEDFALLARPFVALEAVLELHKPERRWQADPSDDFSFDTAREAWGYLHEQSYETAPDEIDESKLRYFDICSECGSLEMGDDPEDKLYRDSLYPCATRRTALKALGVTE